MKTLILPAALSCIILLSACSSTKSPSQPQKSAPEVKSETTIKAPKTVNVFSSGEENPSKLIRAEYVSNDGRIVVVIFDNTINTATLALGDGRVYTLSRALSGSGSRYTDDDESIVFWIKGDNGTLWIDEKIVYSGTARYVTQMDL